MTTIAEIKALTEEQFLKFVTNAILHDFPTFSVLKVTKTQEVVHEMFDTTTIELIINVRVEQPTGKKATKKVRFYKYENGEYKITLPKSWNNYTIEQVLEMDFVNPSYNVDVKDIEANVEREKEAQRLLKIKQANEADQKRIVEMIEWELKPTGKFYKKRTVKQMKTSFKKFSNENMEEAKLMLSAEGVDLLEKIQEELNLPVGVKGIAKNVIKAINNKLVKQLCETFEKTFDEEADEFKAVVRAWLKEDEFFKKHTDRIEPMVWRIVENNKYKLFIQIKNRIGDLDVKNITMDDFETTVKGFAGTWVLELNDGQKKTFHARTIIAEGVRVRPHYRYISTLVDRK